MCHKASLLALWALCCFFCIPTTRLTDRLQLKAVCWWHQLSMPYCWWHHLSTPSCWYHLSTPYLHRKVSGHTPEWDMSFHPEKCQVLCMSRSRKQLVRSTIYMVRFSKSQPHQVLRSYTDLRCHFGGPHQCCQQQSKQDCSGRPWSRSGLQILCQTLLKYACSMWDLTTSSTSSARDYPAQSCSLEPGQVPPNFQ